jgi:hypothetical protein
MLTIGAGMQPGMPMMSGAGYMPPGMHLANGQQQATMMSNGHSYTHNFQAMMAHIPTMQALMAAGQQQMQSGHMPMGSQMQMPGQVKLPPPFPPPLPPQPSFPLLPRALNYLTRFR